MQKEEIFFGESYKLWHEDMSLSMENRKQYLNEKFVLIRKEMTKYYKSLWFGSIEGQYYEEESEVTVKGFHEKLPSDANIFLLHPYGGRRSLNMEFHGDHEDVRLWKCQSVSEDFYSRDSVIFLAELK